MLEAEDEMPNLSLPSGCDRFLCGGIAFLHVADVMVPLSRLRFVSLPKWGLQVSGLDRKKCASRKARGLLIKAQNPAPLVAVRNNCPNILFISRKIRWMGRQHVDR